MSKEIWMYIPEWKGYYQASNKGRIRSVDRIITRGDGQKERRKSRVYYQWIGAKGYMKVNLQKRGPHTKNVHTLIAKAFLDKNYIKKGLQVNHINGIKSDNRLKNLEIVTQKQNAEHAKRTGLLNAPKGERHYNSILTEVDIKIIREMCLLYSQRSIALLYGVTQTNISAISRNKIWKHIK